MDNVECPFCGQWFSSNEPHPPWDGSDKVPCTLSNYSFSAEQWNKRPPKKEQPAIHAPDYEVMNLRRIVDRLLLIIEKK